MRGLTALTVLAAATLALGQEAPKPAEAPRPAEPPKPPEFVAAAAIRKADGMVVHFHRVNYVSADLLVKELERWKTAKAVITAEGPTFAVAPNRQVGGAFAAVQCQLRIEETEENWPILRKVLDTIDVPQAQVWVEAKIVEITYSDDLRIGVRGSVINTLGDTFFQSLAFTFPNRLDAVNNATAVFRDTHKYTTFEYIVDLAQSGAETRIVAQPRIVASQGETAMIRAGDREPIVQQTLQGSNVVATTTWEETGIRLEVQPLLIGRDSVRARIFADASRVSEFRITATSTNLQVVNPVVSKRTADTVVTVPDGETLVIGGMDTDLSKESSTGIPLLKDLPVLGHLFGSTTTQKVRTELVFFLTFSIQGPREAREIKPPSEKARIGEE